MGSFLNAEWRKLAIANYETDPEFLDKYIPPGTELDLWNETCYISLVGFMFVNTKLLGIPIPFHTDFEEVNLRFYVRYNDGIESKRGVVFIKEIVPKPALTLVANTMYKEHYETLPMEHEWIDDSSKLEVSYRWQKEGRWNSIRVEAEAEQASILPGSEAEFITEHYWGYTKVGDAETSEYEVTHPRWNHYPVKQFQIDVDFGAVYGAEFAFLSEREPKSVMLAEGSKITVENKKEITAANKT